MQVWARAKAPAVSCPGCGGQSARVHSRYDRQVTDAAIAGRPVLVRLQVRRLFCDGPDCAVRTFAEQVPGLTSPYARRTPVLRGMLEAIGLALAGRAGARLARRLGLGASRDTLLRLVRALPDPSAGASQDPTPVPAAVDPDPGGRQARLRARTQQRYEAVHRLRAQGKGLRTIADELDIDRKTARRFAQAASAEEVIAKATSRVMLLDEFIPHLLRRWASGCTDIAALTAGLRQLGYRGSERTVYRYLQPYRTGRTPCPHAGSAKPTPPKIRTVTAWIMRDPGNLTEDDAVQLQQILARCPELAATRRHVGAFAAMIRDLRGDRLPGWIGQVPTTCPRCTPSSPACSTTGPPSPPGSRCPTATAPPREPLTRSNTSRGSSSAGRNSTCSASGSCSPNDGPTKLITQPAPEPMIVAGDSSAARAFRVLARPRGHPAVVTRL